MCYHRIVLCLAASFGLGGVAVYDRRTDPARDRDEVLAYTEFKGRLAAEVASGALPLSEAVDVILPTLTPRWRSYLDTQYPGEPVRRQVGLAIANRAEGYPGYGRNRGKILHQLGGMK